MRLKGWMPGVGAIGQRCDQQNRARTPEEAGAVRCSGGAEKK